MQQKVYNYKIWAASHIRLTFFKTKFMQWWTVIPCHYCWSREMHFYNARFLLDRTVEVTGPAATWSNNTRVTREDGDTAANLLGQLSCKCHFIPSRSSQTQHVIFKDHLFVMCCSELLFAPHTLFFLKSHRLPCFSALIYRTSDFSTHIYYRKWYI